MSTEDVARIIVYSAVILPSAIFCVTYVACLFFVRRTPEAFHLLAFTAGIGWVATEILAAHLGLWDFSLARFLIAVGACAVFLFQRVYMLYRYLAIPLMKRGIRRRRERRVEALD